MDRLIRKVKNFQKQKLIGRTWDSKFAFTGVGKHSLGNLYPVIDYLKVPLKHIVTQSEANARAVDQNFPGVIGTSDLILVLSDNSVKGVFICAPAQAQPKR
jgi:virulence factor